MLLPWTNLGATNIQVSCLGLGTVKFGRNQQVKYPQDFQIPDDQQLKNLLAMAKSYKINLIDTAPAYGTSEQRLGKLLTGQRQDWVIVTKAGENFINGQSIYNFTPKYLENSIKQSLKNLQTDYLDVVLIHSSGEDVNIIQQQQVFVTLDKLKQAGYIRAFGMSTKTIAGGLLTVEQADVVMLTYNQNYQEEKVVLDRALALNKGILIKKALNSGHLVTNIDQALQFIYQQPAVNSIIIGTINGQHLQENINMVKLAYERSRINQ